MSSMKDITKEDPPKKKETYADRYKKVYGKSHLKPDKKPEPEKDKPKSTLQKLWEFVTGPSKKLEEAASQ